MNRFQNLRTTLSNSRLLIVIAAIAAISALVLLNPLDKKPDQTTEQQDFSNSLTLAFPDLDLDSAIIEVDQILSGGPGKDGIPSIDQPNFIDVEQSKIDNDVLGIVYEGEATTRFYPYNILVWHEIVNDVVDNRPIAVTFCPLCGSAVVFDRTVNNQVLEFGVSGFLFESNLLMYDRQTESLWSQSLGQAVVGEMAGDKLDVLNFELMEFAEAKSSFDDLVVLSPDTGYARNYDFYPYGDYQNNDQLLFEVSQRNEKFPIKEIFYVIPADRNNGKSLAIRFRQLPENSETDINQTFTISNRDGLDVTDKAGMRVPGYYEMWFSWATQHPNGEVWQP